MQKQAFNVAVEPHGLRVRCGRECSVLSAVSFARSGVLAVGCRSGGCGICRVQVLEGDYQCGAMSREQVEEGEQADGYALACQLFPRSDLRLRVAGRRVAAGDAGKTFDALLRSLSISNRPNQ